MVNGTLPGLLSLAPAIPGAGALNRPSSSSCRRSKKGEGVRRGHCAIRRAGCVEGKGSGRKEHGPETGRVWKAEGKLLECTTLLAPGFPLQDTSSLQWLEKETGQISLG